ncbi:uncharacterized protein LOC105382408 [Plutella xylostella]|uniref:uncharacterized protein LOC105382408 n=1 Tax=Plutella xylostella TaxID=51655 RepID=UPI00203279FF|nr:uncharacterized protein LOC105382408 [Plutella xylostella]
MIGITLITVIIAVIIDAQKPTFRILAPQFVCPKDDKAIIEKPEETVIMVQTAAGQDLDMRWTVRWTPLQQPSQRDTLMVWRAVRALEAKLNAPQPVPYVYVIENEQLLRGVDFKFTVTGSSHGVTSDPKTFHIDNSAGDSKLQHVEGRADLFSISLLGSQVAYADVEYVLEALVTMCTPTEDYHFQWTVQSVSTDAKVDVSSERGARLAVPAMSMVADLAYNAQVDVIKTSSGAFLTHAILPFSVLRRGLEVYLSADQLAVSVDTPFYLEASVFSHDFYADDLKHEWSCLKNDEPCDLFTNEDSNEILIDPGIPEAGKYEISVTVTVKDEFGSAKMIVEAVESVLPVLQVSPVARVVNAGAQVSLTVNATRVAPSCSITWYFMAEEQMHTSLGEGNCSGSECQHGVPLTETLTIYSLEENFLNELADFSNETEWRQVTAEMAGNAGRARILVECGCSLALGCTTQGFVYADVMFQVNTIPMPGIIMVSPPIGVALESIHRISTLAVVDPDTPLKYSFYCGLGAENSLLLGFYYEHLSIETFLPYVEGGTEVWVEVCDARDACQRGPSSLVQLSPGQGRTVSALIESARGHLRRCEVMMLQRTAVAGLVTYINTNLEAILGQFSAALTEMLSSAEAAACKAKRFRDFDDLLHSLVTVGFEINKL